MKFKGLVVKQSLVDNKILDTLNVTKTELWDSGWEVAYIEGPEADAPGVAEKLSKVFKYPKGNKEERQIVTNYARQIGIPEDQLGWGE